MSTQQPDTHSGASELNEREKRLFELRLKLNAARQKNVEEVKAEEVRAARVPGVAGAGEKKEKEEGEGEGEGEKGEKGKEKGKKKRKKNKEDDETRRLNVTISESEWNKKMRHKKEKRRAPVGPAATGLEAKIKSYHKRVKLLPTADEIGYEQQKREAEARGETFYPTADAAGTSFSRSNNSQADVDRMAFEVKQQIEQRHKFSRRRRHINDQDISYINERNKMFNEKAGRFFDKYTAGLKQDLERGTAL